MFQTFSGNSIQPGQVSYTELSISASATLVWPDFATDSQQDVVSLIIDVTASIGGLTITMPDATETGNGTTVLFNNIGAQTVTVLDSQGNTLGSIGAGIVKFLYLYDNATVGGSWRIFTFGTGTSAADAASLAGLGLQAQGGTLAQSMPTTAKNGSWTIDANSLAQSYAVSPSTGSVVVTLPTSATMGSNLFFFLKNGGTGTATLTPSGGDTVDGAATVALSPNDACIVFSDGANNRWWTLGLGRNVTFAFTQLVKNVAGSSDVTLTSAEAANKIMTFTGLLTGNINVKVPNIASVYYVYNNTTGAFTLTVKTVAGTGVVVTQGARDILVCDATNVLQAITNLAATTLFGVGSAAAPSITFVGFSDDGIYHPANDQVGITTAGVLRTLFTTTGIDNQSLRLQAVGAATVATDAPKVAQVQDGNFLTCGTVAGTANAITLTSDAVAITAYARGQKTRFKAAFNNTAAVVVNRDTIGNRAVLCNGFPLIGGEIRKNCSIDLYDDGVNLNLTSVTPAAPSIGQFAVHEKETPDLTVFVDTGRINTANSLVSNAQQSLGGFTATGANQRIDRVVMDIVTGVATRVAGTESASPAAPAIPGGKLSLAQIGPFTTITAAITNSMITDERSVFTDYMFAQNAALINNLLLA